MRNKRSPVLTCCPSVKLRSFMKPEIRATTSTLSIAATRPMKSPVDVTSRLTTGVTVTAGGGAPCAAAAWYPVSKMDAANRDRATSGQLRAIDHSRTGFTHTTTQAKNGHQVYFADSSLASSVICALSTLETGHDFSALPANSLNFASSRLGTLARNVSAERVMRKP